MPPRICFVVEIFHPEDPGGQGRQTYDLAEELTAQGSSVHALTRRHLPTSNIRERIGRVSVHRLPPLGISKGQGWRAVWPTALFFSRLLFELLRTARRYDVLVVFGVKGILLPSMLAARLLGKPIVIKADASAELDQAITAESLASMGLKPSSLPVRAWSRIRSALLRQADALIAISGELHDLMVRIGIDRRRILDLPNGIDLARWHPVDAATKQALRDRLQLPAGPLFTYVGRLSHAKGVLNLMSAWQVICERHPNAHLLIVGSGIGSYDDCEAELQALSRAVAGRVTFTGQVVDTREYLQASDVFVQCSETEGFGLALVEAMACGLPCVSTPVGAARDVVQPNRNGLLIPIHDVDAIVAAIDQLLAAGANWQELGTAARKAVLLRYDLRSIATGYLHWLDRLNRNPDASAALLQE
jgi:glycosyltransferase involved in cell wall biosynthesis